jgi:hypothetical protein
MKTYTTDFIRMPYRIAVVDLTHALEGWNPKQLFQPDFHRLGEL